MTTHRRLILSDKVRRNSATLSAEIDGEAVALDIARGSCYGMDPAAAHIWRMIETTTVIEAVCDTLQEVYDVEDAVCQRDVLDLLEDLRAADLIMVETGASGLGD